ncbi:MAG TPA: glycosyltransferase family 4 protein [Verrucomicrobiae bacterium]|nr:glycosyltransferase family 4 protein [Verrucomicrobiae bacterium]
MASIEAIYLARDDALNVETWSGTPYWIGKALEKAGFRLHYACPIAEPYRLYYRIKGRLIRMMGWDYSPAGERPWLRAYGRRATRLIAGKGGRVLFSCGRPQLPYLHTDLPIVFFDDASVPAITRTHPSVTNLFPAAKARLLEAERRVIEKCSWACYSSEWAAEGAARTYGGILEPKIKVVPFGANMDVERSEAEVDSIIRGRNRQQCNLLFVGRHWENKGGPIAVAAAEELHRRGVNVRLDVVGPDLNGALPGFVRAHGFVSKNTVAGRDLLAQLYRESHFFILPTRFEAYGIVFVEAASYGLPSLASRVGGVPTIVRSGINGELFGLEDGGAGYADFIMSHWTNGAAYEALCRSAFQDYGGRLSWNCFGQTVRDLVVPLLK